MATPSRGELPDDLEQPLAFGRRQGGGRLVHDQDARLDRQRLGDLDQLLLADAQGCRRARPGSRSMPSRCSSARGGARLALRSTISPAMQRLAAEEDVVGDGELGDEVEFLMDDGDAGGLRVADAGEAHRPRRRSLIAPS